MEGTHEHEKKLQPTATRSRRLPPEVISRIITLSLSHPFDGPEMDPDDYSKIQRLVIRTLVSYASVSTDWATAALDRALWLSLGVNTVFLSYRMLPNPSVVSPRLNRLFNSFPAPLFTRRSRQGNHPTSHVSNCVDLGRTRFSVAQSLFKTRKRERHGALWAELAQIARPVCTALIVFDELDDSDSPDPVVLPPLEPYFQAIALNDLIAAGSWPRLEALGLEVLWGGVTVYDDSASGSSRVTRLTRLKMLAERAEARGEAPDPDHAVLPNLKFMSLLTNPGLFDLGQVLRFAPRLSHFYIHHRKNSPLRLHPRSPFLFGEREYRIFWHHDFMHVHRWPGPRIGHEMRKLWCERLEVCVPQWIVVFDSSAQRPVDLCEAEHRGGTVKVVERWQGKFWEACIDIKDLFEVHDLHSLVMKPCDGFPQRPFVSGDDSDGGSEEYLFENIEHYEMDAQVEDDDDMIED